MFSGSIPALVTPFAADGSFDEDAFRDLVEWQIAEGSAGLVAVRHHRRGGDADLRRAFRRRPRLRRSGEGPRAGDRRRGIERHARRDRQRPRREGGRRRRRADGAALLQPPEPGGHLPPFRGDRAATRSLPIVLYNVPGRTVTDIQPATMARIVAGVPRRVHRREGRDRQRSAA